MRRLREPVRGCRLLIQTRSRLPASPGHGPFITNEAISDAQERERERAKLHQKVRELDHQFVQHQRCHCTESSRGGAALVAARSPARTAPIESARGPAPAAASASRRGSAGQRREPARRRRQARAGTSRRLAAARTQVLLEATAPSLARSACGADNPSRRPKESMQRAPALRLKFASGRCTFIDG